jgi:xanthine dehydrogenase accessory factor
LRRDILETVMADRAARRPAVLLTQIGPGEKVGAEIVLHPLDASAPAGTAPEVWAAARAALEADRSTTVDTASGPAFLHVFNTPLRLCVVGAVHIAQALAPMAALAGFAVLVVDPRRAFATAERFPGVELLTEWPDQALLEQAPDRRTAVVTLTHDPKLDDPALAAALRGSAFYIGALGSKKTHAARLERLRAEGFSDAELARIHGPVGLDIGARTAGEIAVAVLGDVVASLRREAS